MEFQQAFGRHSTMIPHHIQQLHFIAPTLRPYPYTILARERFNSDASLTEVYEMISIIKHFAHFA